MGVALLTGLRRGELLRASVEGHQLGPRDTSGARGGLRGAVRHAGDGGGVAGGAAAGGRGDAAAIVGEQVRRREPDDLVFATVTGKPISPNNVLRRWVFLACDKLKLAM